MNAMTEGQIKQLVDRFLGWRLPTNFSPDAGISYTRPNFHPDVDATPSGTNLFDATQADAMVRYMVVGMCAADINAEIDEGNMVTQAEWDAARDALPPAIEAQSAFGAGWNAYIWDLISEGFLMEALAAAAKVRSLGQAPGLPDDRSAIDANEVVR